jgi:hypothetical protein
MKRLAVVAAVACLCGCALAVSGRADSYSVSGTIDTNGAASVDPFDASKGTLTGVSWVADANLDGSVSLTNNSSQNTSNGSVKLGLFFGGSGPDGIAASDKPGLDIAFSLNPGDSGTFTGSLSNTISPRLTISNLSDYEGPGQVDFSFSQSISSTFISGGGGTASLNSDSSSFGSGSEVTVTYTFTPNTTAAPEPASLTLLGVGALGLAGYGWRRRRRAAA